MLQNMKNQIWSSQYSYAFHKNDLFWLNIVQNLFSGMNKQVQQLFAILFMHPN
jgi:hypothetical protein